MKSVLKLFFLAFAILMSSWGYAAAQTCSATIESPINFTGIDLLAGGDVDTRATLTVSCTGLLGVIQACVSFDAGTGGANGSAYRQMQRVGGSEKLNFQLYSDATRTIPWGSVDNQTLGNVPRINVPIVLLGTGTATQPVYARVFGNQTTVPPGTYKTTISTNLRYGTLSGLTGCNDLLLSTSHPGPTFDVQATLAKNCLISIPQHVNFGTVQLLNSNIDAAGALSARCTSGTPYHIGLGPGNAAGATITNRRMTGPGGATISYQLFRDSNRTMNWGQTVDSDTLPGKGSGVAVPVPVYGRVPPQATPPVGTYTDNVVVTITY